MYPTYAMVQVEHRLNERIQSINLVGVTRECALTSFEEKVAVRSTGQSAVPPEPAGQIVPISLIYREH
jgi:hypothetical protein